MPTDNTAPTTDVELMFNAREVREQIEHTKTAPLHKLTMSDRAELYGEDKMAHLQPDEENNGTPGLWLVKDSGIYLMSNGNPGQPNTENNHNGASQLKVAYAKGYGPTADYYKISEAVGGDDFTEGTLEVECFESALQLAEKHHRDEIVVIFGEHTIKIGC